MVDIDQRFRDAVQRFWAARDEQQRKPAERGTIDAGTRGAVTGGTQMGALEVLVVDILADVGLDHLDIHTRTALESTLHGLLREEVHGPVNGREGMPLRGDGYRVDNNR